MTFDCKTDEWRDDIRPGYYTKVVKVGKATVEIHRPILTAEEQAKRENQVMDALRAFGRSMERSVIHG